MTRCSFERHRDFPLGAVVYEGAGIFDWRTAQFSLSFDRRDTLENQTQALFTKSTFTLEQTVLAGVQMKLEMPTHDPQMNAFEGVLRR